MPNRLRDLTITEISLVDRPANAETDPATGEKISRATVALFKRDDSQPKEKVMTPPLKLSQIRKSADHLTFSREAIAAAVFNKAQKIAKKRNISVEEAEARVWKKNPIVVALYDARRRRYSSASLARP